ncbi:MAG: tetratricopeptide repeat protein [Planctomycetaceae bacterium]
MRISTPRPVVDSLLARATEFAAEGALHHAESFFAAAIAADEGATARIAYGTHLAELGEFDEAIRLLLKAWEQAKRDGSSQLRAWACQSLASSYRETGDFIAASQFQQLAIRAELDSYSGGEGSSLSTESRLGRASDWLQSSEFADAESLLQTCRTIDGDEGMSATAELNLGVAALRTGDIETALQRFYSAFQQFQDMQDAAGTSRALEAIAKVQLSLGNWTVARNLLDKANRLARHVGQRHRVRQLADAIVRLDRALKLLEADPLLN